MCADDPNGSTSSGTQLDLWRCHGYASNGAMQRWLFVPSRFSQTGRPVYQVYNVAGNLCLTAVDAHPAKPLTLGPCIDNISETWELHTVIGPSGGENFQLEPWPSEDFNTCMSASNFTDSNGTRLVMETCDRYDTSQLWNLG